MCILNHSIARLDTLVHTRAGGGVYKIRAA
jgi:hypothetical protein